MLIRTVLRVYLGTWTSCTRARRISASHKFTLLSIPPSNPPPPTLTAEFYGRGLRPPGLRARETTHTRTQDTHAGVLAVHRVFLFSICTWLPLVGCGAYLCWSVLTRCRCTRRSERREPEEGSSIYIRNISLFWCSFCKCCIPDYLLERAQCSVPR